MTILGIVALIILIIIVCGVYVSWLTSCDLLSFIVFNQFWADAIGGIFNLLFALIESLNSD